MFEQISSPRYIVEIAIAVAIGLVIYCATCCIYPSNVNKNITKKADGFRIPINNTLVILGLLVPVLMTSAAYFYLKYPTTKIESLLATITLMFIILCLAIFLNFSLLQKTDDNDKITLKMPNDRYFMFIKGLLYSYLVLGLLYFAIFFLFEIKPPLAKETIEKADHKGCYFLEKSKLNLYQSKDDVLKIWGEPSSDKDNKLTYVLEYSVLVLTFDENQYLVEINEKRR